MTDPNQPDGANIFSRQYIEEWLRYSAGNLIKYTMAQQQSAGGSATTAAPSGGTSSAENATTGAENSDYVEEAPDVKNFNCLYYC